MLKYIFTYLALCLTFSGSHMLAQHTKEQDFTEHINKSKAQYHVKTDYPTTGIVVSIKSTDSFEEAYLVAKDDTLWLSSDEHFETSNRKVSNLQTTSTAFNEFIFNPGNISQEVTFTFIDARLPSEKKKEKSLKKKSSDCSEPEMIEQSVWRVGLTEPNFDRISHDVHNLIIHHTAGSNTDTNYTQVVRNIYIYHTEVRGWSDIGYNYLIAQDGTIFKGRDPEIYEQDNVMGAHFCASNTGTMGISIMGNYNDVVPADTAINSLVNLLNWKAGKDSLDPVGKRYHPLNAQLYVISGHRDGCATECPGQLLYNQLEEIRTTTWDSFLACDFVIKAFDTVNGISALESNIQVIQKGKDIFLNYWEPFDFYLYDYMGNKISYKLIENDLYSKGFFIEDEKPGIYYLIIRSQGNQVFRKLFIP